MAGIRKKKRAGWPPHLYARVKAGRTYYFFLNPKTRRETGLGTDLAKAIEVAKLVGKKTAEDPVQRLLRRLDDKPGITVEDACREFVTKVMPNRRTKNGKPRSEKTIREYTNILRSFCQDHGNSLVAEVTRAECFAYIEDKPPKMAKEVRGLLKQVFDHAISMGAREDNPIDKIKLERQAVVERHRLSMEQFQALRSLADPWFQRAMDLALYSLQRREDLCSMRVEDFVSGRLYIVQRKTEGHAAANLAVRPGPQLQAALDALLRAERRARDCPFILFFNPKRKMEAKDREHFQQVLPDLLTKTFSELRDEHLELFPGLKAAQLPTFHEIRSLGSHYYEKELGWPVEKVQALMGHTNVKMTELYLSRRGVKWIDVEAG